jgi:hypothetical protein
MKLPGLPAAHAIIRDGCREAHGEMGAFEEAVARLRREYEACLAGWPRGKGVQFHVLLIVERPPREGR